MTALEIENLLGPIVCSRCGDRMAAMLESSQMFVCEKGHARFVTLREIEAAERAREAKKKRLGLKLVKGGTT